MAYTVVVSSEIVPIAVNYKLSTKLGALSATSTTVESRDHMATVVVYGSPNISLGAIKSFAPLTYLDYFQAPS